jgi:hypothetical protein
MDEEISVDHGDFKLDMSDVEITKTLNARINESRDYFNDITGYDLRRRRKRNQKFLEGDHWYDSRIRTDIPYVQNEIYTAQQVISAYVTAQIPEIEVSPNEDTPEGRRLAQSVHDIIKHHSEEHDLQGVMCDVVGSMLNNYFGGIELSWDADYGDNGDIIIEHTPAEDVIVDHHAKKRKNPAFISFTQRCTANELITLFPNKKKAIKEKVRDNMNARITWRKVYVTVYIDDKPTEGLVFYFDDVVLAKVKSPHWIYDEETEGITNYLQKPRKPIVPFNFVNDGKHWIDKTGPMDQVVPIQRMLNRIGRQIQLGIAHSAPILVFSAKALPKPQSDKIQGKPWEKITVDSKDVNTAYGVIQANPIPSFVVNEIGRLAMVLHEIMGTPPQLRGESGQQTASQDLMARDEAHNRLDLLVRAIDRGMNEYASQLLQFIKVHYTAEHFAVVAGEDGRYSHARLKRDDIKDGIKVSVKAGSTPPINKARMEKIAIELAQQGKISLLSLYEFLGIPNPGKHVERVLKEQLDPVTTIENIRNDEQDANAIEDYDLICDGQSAPPRDDVDTRHIMTHNKQLASNDFKARPVEVQQALQMHIQDEIEKAKMLNNITQEDLYPAPEQVGINASISSPAGETQPPEVAPPQAMAPPAPPAPPMV